MVHESSSEHRNNMWADTRSTDVIAETDARADAWEPAIGAGLFGQPVDKYAATLAIAI